MPDVLSAALTHKAVDLVDINETSLIAATARVIVRKNTGTDVGARRRLNFVEGSGVTITLTDVPGSEEVVVNIAASASVTSVSLDSGAASGYVARAKLTADTTYRAVLGLDASGFGALTFGPGGAAGAQDVHIYRGGTSQIKIDIDGAGGDLANGIQLYGYLRTWRPTSANVIIQGFVTGDTQPRFQVVSTGSIAWGDGTAAVDVNLYRSAVDVLKTDDSFSIAGAYLAYTGLVRSGGTAFPGSPATGDRFFRTDRGMEFFYDGTRWLTTQIYEYPLRGHNFTPPMNLAATTVGALRDATPSLRGGTDIWLMDYTETVIIAAGGTALGASHKWVETLLSYVDGAVTFSTLGTISWASGASAVWRRQILTINALLSFGTVKDAFQVDTAKTGTPGNLQFYGVITYRIVAT